MSLPLSADGKTIDWTLVRESRRAGVLQLLRSDPQVRDGASSAAAAGAAPSSSEVFSAPMAGMLFDMLGSLEVAAVMSSMKVSRERANIMLYSDQEKAILTGPLIKVLNKYGSSWMAKWGDEIALGMLFVAVHAPKLTVLQQGPTRAADVLPFGAPAASAPGGNPNPEPEQESNT